MKVTFIRKREESGLIFMFLTDVLCEWPLNGNRTYKLVFT